MPHVHLRLRCTNGKVHSFSPYGFIRREETSEKVSCSFKSTRIGAGAATNECGHGEVRGSSRGWGIYNQWLFESMSFLWGAKITPRGFFLQSGWIGLKLPLQGRNFPPGSELLVGRRHTFSEITNGQNKMIGIEHYFFNSITRLVYSRPMQVNFLNQLHCMCTVFFLRQYDAMKTKSFIILAVLQKRVTSYPRPQARSQINPVTYIGVERVAKRLQRCVRFELQTSHTHRAFDHRGETKKKSLKFSFF